MPPVIDTHIHIWKESYPGRGYPWTPDPHPIEALLPVIDSARVDAVVQVTPMMLEWDNQYGLEVASDHPARLAIFGRFDPVAPEPERRLRAWMEKKYAAGVRMTFFGPDADALHDRTMAAFWQASERLEIPVAVFAPDHLPDLLRVMERHPRLRLIVDHLGLGVYPGCPNPLAAFPILHEFAPFEQVLVKVSGAVEVSREPFPFADVHELVGQAADWFTPERLLWASNYPVVLIKCSYQHSLDYIGHAGVFDSNQLAAVLGGNASELLRRSSGEFQFDEPLRREP